MTPDPFTVINAATAIKETTDAIKIKGMNEKTTKGFASGMKSIVEAGNNGTFQDMTSMFKSMQASSPGAAALDIFMAKIQSQTAASSAELLTSLMEAMESPAGQKGIKALSDLVIFLNESASSIVTGVSQIINDPTENVITKGWVDPLTVPSLIQDPVTPPDRRNRGERENILRDRGF